MADDKGPAPSTLGIIPTGQSDPYEGDTEPTDEMAQMFADADESDEVGAAPEPERFEDDDDEDLQPAPPPESDEEEEGEPGAEAAPVEGEELVTEGTTEEDLQAEVDEEARRLAGRFETVDQLEQGYKEIQGGFTRMAQDLQREEQVREQYEQLIQNQQSQLDQLTTALTAQMAESDPEFAERLRQQQAINQQISERFSQFEDQYAVDPEEEAEQQAQQAAIAQGAANVRAFYERTQIQPGSPEDRRLERAMRTLLQAGVPVDMRFPQHIDAVHEASKDDNLLLELTMAPNAINVPGGMDRLRGRLGATIPATTSAPSPEQETQPRSTKGPTRKRLEGHVETPGGGAPVQTAPATGDEFDEAASYYNSRYRKGPLFGQRS